MMNLEITLLKQQEIERSRSFGSSSQLEALVRYGVLAANTDLAILMGSNTPRFDSYILGDKTLKGRTGSYYTQTLIYDDSVQVILNAGENMAVDVGNRGVGIRPVIKSEELVKMALNYAKDGVNGTKILEYGEYPQYVVNSDLANILESLYVSDSLSYTGKTYTFDGRKYNESIKPFEPVEYAEFEVNGKKFVRVLANPYDEYGCKLSNGSWYQRKDGVWLEVDTVKWLIDEKSGSLVSLNCLLAGIRFNDPCKGYDGDIRNTEMYRYLNTIMKKDLFTIAPKVRKNPSDKAKMLEKKDI